MADIKALLGDQLPKLALSFLAAKQAGPVAAAAFLEGLQRSQLRQQQLARQAEMDAAALEQQDFARQNMLDDNARQDEAARIQRLHQALGLIQQQAQMQGETADDPALAQQSLQQTAQSAAGLYGVDHTQLSGMVPNVAPVISKRKQKQALDRYEALKKIYGEEAVATDAITDNGELFKGMKPSQILAVAGMGAQDTSGAQAAPYVKPPTAERPQAPPNTGSFEDFVLRKYGANPTAENILEGRKLYQQSDDRPPAVPTDPNGLKPMQEFSVSERLAKAWSSASQSKREMQRQLSLMETGLQRFRAGDKNGGSQGVLVTFQKILDPASVVRESEYARTAAGQSAMSRMQGFVERLAVGGAGMTDGELSAMVETARAFLSEMDTHTAGQRRRIEAQAKKYGIDPATVFDDVLLGSSETAAPTAAPTAPIKVGKYTVTVQ